MDANARRDAARDLVLRYGWNTTCYQIVNPQMEKWFGSDSVVGYVERYGVKVVAGAPVCEKSDLPATLSKFEETAKRSVCYFGAEERLHRATRDAKHYSTTVLGAQPVWSPESWNRSVYADSSLRAQFHRASNKGVVVREIDAGTATNSPELHQILNEWLATRGLPTMHFLVEPDTLGFLKDRRVFGAFQDDQIVGFTTLCPVPQRNGWLTEQFVRGHRAPNGTVELMVDFAIDTIRSEGAEFVTMGMVPLSQDGHENKDEDVPAWLKVSLSWIRAHGRRFYNFDGLNWFKNKFHPDRWDPIYAISSEPRISFRTIYAISAAFTGMPPWLAVLKGMRKGISKEYQWLAHPKR